MQFSLDTNSKTPNIRVNKKNVASHSIGIVNAPSTTNMIPYILFLIKSLLNIVFLLFWLCDATCYIIHFYHYSGLSEPSVCSGCSTVLNTLHNPVNQCIEAYIADKKHDNNLNNCKMHKFNPPLFFQQSTQNMAESQSICRSSATRPVCDPYGIYRCLPELHNSSWHFWSGYSCSEGAGSSATKFLYRFFRNIFDYRFHMISAY